MMNITPDVKAFAQQTNFVLNPPANKALEDSWASIASALEFRDTRPVDTVKAIQEHLNVINQILANQHKTATKSENQMDIKAVIQSIDDFVKEAAKKSKKKLDPKAKVRNRGSVVFPAESPNVLDSKDHFELNNEGQARSALSRSHQYDKAPPWYKGSLKSLQEAVRRKVHSKYPGIEIGDKKSSLAQKLLAKYADLLDR